MPEEKSLQASSENTHSYNGASFYGFRHKDKISTMTREEKKTDSKNELAAFENDRTF